MIYTHIYNSSDSYHMLYHSSSKGSVLAAWHDMAENCYWMKIKISQMNLNFLFFNIPEHVSYGNNFCFYLMLFTRICGKHPPLCQPAHLSNHPVCINRLWAPMKWAWKNILHFTELVRSLSILVAILNTYTTMNQVLQFYICENFKCFLYSYLNNVFLINKVNNIIFVGFKFLTAMTIKSTAVRV
jgi:hypothetical protein